MPDPTDPIKPLSDKDYLKKANKSRHYFNYSGSRSNAGNPEAYNERVEFFPGITEDGTRQYEDMLAKSDAYATLMAPVRAAFLKSGKALTTAEAEAISPGIGAAELEIKNFMRSNSSIRNNGIPSHTGKIEIESGKGLSANAEEEMYGPMKTSQLYGLSREDYDYTTERTGTPSTVRNAGEIQREVNAGQKVWDDRSGKYIPVSTTATSLNREVQANDAAYINNPYSSEGQVLGQRKTDAKPISKSFHKYGGPLGNTNDLIQDIQNNPQQANIDLNKAKFKELQLNGHYTRQMTEGPVDPNSIYNPTTRKEGLPYKTMGNRFNDIFTRGNDPVPHLRQDNIQYGVGGDIGAGIYGAAEGVLDTATFGMTDKLTDKVKFNDPQSEAIRAGANVAGNVAGAFLNPAAVGTAVSQSGDNLKDLANTGVIKNDNLNTALNVVGTGAEIGGSFMGGGAGGTSELSKFAQGAQNFSQNPLAQTAMEMVAYGGNIYANGGPFRNDGPRAQPQGDIYLPFDGEDRGSIGVEFDGKEMLIPTVWDGKQHTNEEAIQRYKETGENIGGPFETEKKSTEAAIFRDRNNHPAYRKENAYGGPINPYACGGTMKHGDGGNLSNTTKYNGLTHEEGGLPLGNTNNEVEDGEVRWDNKGDSYIFSNRF